MSRAFGWGMYEDVGIYKGVGMYKGVGRFEGESCRCAYLVPATPQDPHCRRFEICPQ